MHGGLRAAHHYIRLASALAADFTVFIPDRRGRGLSDPVGEGYSVKKEIEDLTTILDETGARMVFGHSGGGLFALEAALVLPIEKLALYEPAVSIYGSLPITWVFDLEQALAREDYPSAMVQVVKGLPLNWMSKMPAWMLRPLFARMLGGNEGSSIKELLHTGVWEGKEAVRLDSTHEKYCDIRAETLLVGGGNSPTFLLDVLPILETTLSHARLIILAGLNHTAPDEDAPEAVAEMLKPFFLGE